MKSAILFPAVILCAAAALAQAPAPLLQNPAGRSTTSLNGDWHAIVDAYDVGESRRYYENLSPASSPRVVEYDFAASPTLRVPADWNSQRPDLWNFEGTVWYEKTFAHTARAGLRTFLYFGAANYRTHVWLNGKSLCEHEGGFTAFDCDATPLLKDGENFVVVRVNSTRHADDLPGLHTDWWNYGGLTRDVMLVDLPDVYVQDYSLQLQRGAGNHIAGWARLAGGNGPQKLTVRIPELRVVRDVTTDADGAAKFDFDVPGLERWSPEHPKLYGVEIAAGEDRVRDEIGFRTIETRGVDILLNGRPVFLRGINLHEEAPDRPGRAHGEDDARTLLTWAKGLGCNFVRLAHYPHDESMTRMADRMGVMVWSEIPLYWDISFTDPKVLDRAKHMFGENVARDHNRASVILWSLSNETPREPARTAFLHELATYARTLDATRLITSATNRSSHPEPHQVVIDDPLVNDLDVVGVNEYIGWYEGVAADADVTTFTMPANKPMIISEFGGDARYGLHGPASQRWTEEFQEDIYRHQIAAFARIPFLRGTAPWILKDFRSPVRQLPGIQDGFNRKGLISDHGERKKAYFVLQQYYRDLAARDAAK